MAESQVKPILVLGVGNELLCDEGVGVHLVRRLSAAGLPPQAEAVEGGTCGADLVDDLPGRRSLIVVDCADMGIAPGTVREFSVEQLAGPDEVSASLHDVGLMETLLMARLLGECPDDIVVFGVQPGNLSWGTSLSPAVLRALPDLTACVLDAVFRRLAVAEPSGD